MNIKLVAFGIAKEILKQTELEFKVDKDTEIGGLKALLISKYPEFEKLKSLRFAVNEDYQTDEYKIKSGDEVVIIPPVSGG